MTDLPAHLQNNRAPRLAERSTEGMGLPLPPHISIRGNEFTLVDSASQQRTIDTKHLDVCIIDISDHMNKLYYGKDYSPDSNDPPLCFSANGVAPSRDAMSPQSATCMQCPHNVRGSAVSKLTGAPIKACRDEKWLAVLVPGIDIGWQFRLTPGSFSNYRAYAEKFKGQNFDIADVMTRLQFEKDAMGVITFQPASFIDADMAARRNKAIEAKVTDVLVGRTDQPIAALPAPQAQPAAIAAPAAQPAPFGNTAPTAPGAEAPAKRRGRKPASETAAPANGPAPVGAPFRPEPAPPFGVAASAPPPPADIKAQMDSFFNS